MRVGFLFDENMPPRLVRALIRTEPTIDALRVGDNGAPSLGTKDPALLAYLEQSNRVLVTRNRKSMQAHLQAHCRAGRHVPGIVWLKKGTRLQDIVDDLVLIWTVIEGDECTDRLIDVPL